GSASIWMARSTRESELLDFIQCLSATCGVRCATRAAWRFARRPSMLDRMQAHEPFEPDASWDEHYRDERDAAHLYRALATVEPDAERRHLFERLAVVEDRHVERWADLFAESGRPVPAFAPSAKTKLLTLVARWFGPSTVLPLLLAEEGR